MSPNIISLTTDEASGLEHFLFFLFFTSQVSKGVNNDTEDQVKDDDDDHEEEEQVVDHPGCKQRLLKKKRLLHNTPGPRESILTFPSNESWGSHGRAVKELVLRSEGFRFDPESQQVTTEVHSSARLSQTPVHIIAGGA